MLVAFAPIKTGLLLSVLAGVAACLLLGCIGSGAGNSSTKRETPLGALPTGTIEVDGHTLRVWLALTEETRSEGLMWVGAAEIADDQGMLFVFGREQLLSFWMKNTVTPLDIAYARTDGEIVMIHHMPALTLESFPSIEPAKYALEVESGRLAQLGVEVGDHILIPDDVLKQAAQADD